MPPGTMVPLYSLPYSRQSPLVQEVIGAPSPPSEAVIRTPGILLEPRHTPIVAYEVTSLYPPVTVSPMPGEAHVALDLVVSEVNPHINAPSIGPQSAEDKEAADTEAVLDHHGDVMVTSLVNVW